MKKVLNIVLMLCLAVTLISGCSAVPTSSQTKKVDISKITAEEIIALFQAKVENIGDIISYNAENDVNGKLGRPNQYTSKINFADKRFAQPNAESPVGGSIEVFKTEEDCTARSTYIAGVEKAMPLLGSQYIYQYKTVLLRIDDDLTPDQAAEYETVFKYLQ